MIRNPCPFRMRYPRFHTGNSGAVILGTYFEACSMLGTIGPNVDLVKNNFFTEARLLAAMAPTAGPPAF